MRYFSHEFESLEGKVLRIKSSPLAMRALSESFPEKVSRSKIVENLFYKFLSRNGPVDQLEILMETNSIESSNSTWRSDPNIRQVFGLKTLWRHLEAMTKDAGLKTFLTIDSPRPISNLEMIFAQTLQSQKPLKEETLNLILDFANKEFVDFAPGEVAITRDKNLLLLIEPEAFTKGFFLNETAPNWYNSLSQTRPQSPVHAGPGWSCSCVSLVPVDADPSNKSYSPEDWNMCSLERGRILYKEPISFVSLASSIIEYLILWTETIPPIQETNKLNITVLTNYPIIQQELADKLAQCQWSSKLSRSFCYRNLTQGLAPVTSAIEKLTSKQHELIIDVTSLPEVSFVAIC